ncbi:hypothetical protein BLNAU_16958 [Blattamonas nauphoetae]|uniref:Uncharacterized protein n=1 Tax=Blattamonas nauphoetae TaxID=2049346 RepID=A0ABQ9XCY4_9EUKA|nr:hypothetical protein BLNAU_16958 [Blattamonas nauphoetae]
MKCTLTPTSGSTGAGNQAVFTGPSELNINPHSTAMYKLVNTVQSSSSTPSTSADKFSFRIEVDTVARVEQKRKTVVPMANPGHIKYRVNPVAAFNSVSPTKLKSDSKISNQQPTPALSSYPSAQAHSNEYELTIPSTHAGVEEGTLMSITNEEEVNLSTQVRKPITLDLRLFNPSETESIAFAVKMRGMGLTDPPSFHLDSLVEDVYTLIYTPVFPTLILEGVENEEDKQEIESVHQTVDSHMTIARVDALNILGLQNKIVVQPSQTVNFICKLSPSQIDVEEATMIKITSRDGGEWKWNVTGKGLAPTLLPPSPLKRSIAPSLTSIRHKFGEPQAVPPAFLRSPDEIHKSDKTKWRTDRKRGGQDNYSS